MHRIRLLLARLWADERGISSVEYAMLLAFIAAGIIAAAEMLSNAVTNEFSDTAILLDGGGGNCGNNGGSGQGSGNTC